ncbi:MAG: Glu-tRNA(Gln) amidotransferase subunit GatD [Candidatus Woesearchaeota archaeon]
MERSFNFETGNWFLVRTAQGEFYGMIIKEDEEDLVLKLESGYQVSIPKRGIIEAKSLERIFNQKEEKNVRTAVSEKREGLPTISILHAGGTIASKVDYETGAVKAKFSPEEILEMVPELGEIANIKSRLVRNMMSDDMRFAHYNLLAEEVKKEVEAGSDGIIITQGTDTLHYTAAALSFILDGISIPIIIVGSQRSSDRGSSDAALNLTSAAYFISNSDFAGVAVCMHHSTEDRLAAILPACKCRKLHSSRRDAFKAVNSEPIALVDYENRRIKIFSENYTRRSRNFTLKLMPIKENLKIGIIKSHPNMYADEIERFSHYDGIVLEGTGLGHMPITKSDEFTEENEKIFKAIAKIAKEKVVVMSTQTIFGRVNMNVYSPGRKLLDAGVLGNYSDMTPETTFIKLAWLLSNFSVEEIKRNNLMLKNFRGEISEREPLSFI